MMSQEDFRDAFRSEVGDEVYALIRPEEVDRWINRGQARLGFQLQKAVDLSWEAGEVMITLPSDFHHSEKWIVTGGSRPAGEFWGGNYVLTTAAFCEGSATLLYWGEPPAITSDADSVLPQLGDDAAISYALYRFFKRLASSRSDYRRYATISNSNGVDITELDSLSEKHLADFNDARELIQENRQDIATFFES